ncbi:MAG: hypothetical protein M9922_15560 [Microthrixaceae bacterium]|nr:hypothetical protein [Microthrixaceae bacterium]
MIGLEVVATLALLGLVGAGAVLLWWLRAGRLPLDARPRGASAGRLAVAAAVSGVATFGVIPLEQRGPGPGSPVKQCSPQQLI